MHCETKETLSKAFLVQIEQTIDQEVEARIAANDREWKGLFDGLWKDGRAWLTLGDNGPGVYLSGSADHALGDLLIPWSTFAEESKDQIIAWATDEIWIPVLEAFVAQLKAAIAEAKGEGRQGG